MSIAQFSFFPREFKFSGLTHAQSYPKSIIVLVLATLMSNYLVALQLCPNRYPVFAVL